MSQLSVSRLFVSLIILGTTLFSLNLPLRANAQGKKLEDRCSEKNQDGDACFSLAQKWRKKGNEGVAAQWAKKACEWGNIGGCSASWNSPKEEINNSEAVAEKGEDDALTDLTKKCDKKNAQACWDLGAIQQKEGNAEEAQKNGRLACKYGSKTACKSVHDFELNMAQYELNQELYKDRDKCENSDGAACLRIEKACEKQNGDACLHLGYLKYRRGDEEGANDLARKSCEYGSKQGCDMYGKIQASKTIAHDNHLAEENQRAQSDREQAAAAETQRRQQAQWAEQQRQQQEVQAFSNSLKPMQNFLNSMGPQPPPKKTQCKTHYNNQFNTSETECE